MTIEMPDDFETCQGCGLTTNDGDVKPCSPECRVVVACFDCRMDGQVDDCPECFEPDEPDTADVGFEERLETAARWKDRLR